MTAAEPRTQVAAPPVGRPEVARTLFVLATPRYATRVVVPFLVGALAAGERSLAYVVLGVAAQVTNELTSNLANVSSDREGDAVDYPHRTRLARRISYERVDTAARFGLGAYVALVTAMVLLVPMPPLLVVYWLGMMLVGASYSRGPRVKTQTFGAPLLLAAIAPACLAAGYARSGDPVAVAPALVELLLLRLSVAGGKDVNNVRGDTATGFWSIYHRLVGAGGEGDDRAALRRTTTLVTLPYMAIGLLVATGARPPRDLLLVALLPAGLLYARGLVQARSAERATTRDGVREHSYLYELAVTNAALVTIHPHPVTLLLTAASFTWFVAATATAHPEPALLPTWRLKQQLGREPG